MIRLRGMIAASLGVILLCACGTTVRPCYLALGDSYAYGEGASKTSKSSYASIFHEFLEKETGQKLALRNLAVGGETTASMIGEGQLAKALAELRFRNHDDKDDNDVFVITVQIGGNDLLALAREGGPCAPPAELSDTACADAVATALDEVAMNLPAILRAIRVGAGPNVTILVLDYFNPYSGSGKPLDEPGDLVVPALNDVIRRAAGDPAVDAVTVQLFEDFRSRSGQMTHVMEPEEDIHPNDQGYRLIADLLAAAYAQ